LDNRASLLIQPEFAEAEHRMMPVQSERLRLFHSLNY
jgi:hypothetical protein